ncbi:hypothetical protein [Pseudonocardia sp.]|nr:hypothetical protein [Pseudonocardia sp.]
MTIPNPTDAPTLLTDADVLARVRTLVCPACVDRSSGSCWWTVTADRPPS